MQKAITIPGYKLALAETNVSYDLLFDVGDTNDDSWRCQGER